MNLLPQPSGSRPRLACEISPAGIVAARTDAAAPGVLAAVARVKLAAGAVTPSPRPGNIADRVAVVAAVRKALEDVGGRPGARGADMTLVLPDGAVRVLLLDFDSLPNKLSEALPLVRFRLKKLLPFDADDAMVSYQVMSTSKQAVRVLAVAIPRDVLTEYESIIREAGFEPGAVLPSTLATLAGLDATAEPTALVVNANNAGVTAAIVRSGILLLHRSVDLQPTPAATPANLPPALFGNPNVGHEDAIPALPLVSIDDTEEEWALQQPLPEHGHNPYADSADAETAVQNEDGITGLSVPPVFLASPEARLHGADEPAPISHSPYTAPTVLDDFRSELHNQVALSPTPVQEFPGSLANGIHAPALKQTQLQAGNDRDIAEAVSIATAYFEDTLAQVPTRILCAGPIGADRLQQILADAGILQSEGLRVRELLAPDALLSSAVTASVPRGWLAAIAGALRS